MIEQSKKEQSMDKPLFNPKVLKYTHVSHSAKDILEYIDGRRQGRIKSLKTPWRKMNQINMQGLEFQSVHTIAGMSGSGKSSIAGQLEDGLITLNPEFKLSVLNFNYEMISKRIVGRKIGSKLNLTVQQLYSGINGYKLDDTIYKQAQEEAERLSKHNIYYVDLPGNAEEMYYTILDFANQPNIRNTGIIIFLDHALLTKGKQGEKERETLYSLMAMFNAVKKILPCIIIILSQLNRDIESSERIQNPLIHSPRRSDLFGADAVYMYSDTVMVSHRPEMLGITSYTQNRWPTKNMVFWHYLKCRDGEPCVAAMVNDLAHNRILDYEPPKVTIESKENNCDMEHG